LVVFFGAVYYIKKNKMQKISLVVEFLFLLFFVMLASDKDYIAKILDCSDSVRVLSMVLMFTIFFYGMAMTYKRSKSEYDK